MLLLPEDPDTSAARLRDGLMARWQVPLAVLISDSFGRAWRRGVVNVASASLACHPFWTVEANMTGKGERWR